MGWDCEIGFLADSPRAEAHTSVISAKPPFLRGPLSSSVLTIYGDTLHIFVEDGISLITDTQTTFHPGNSGNIVVLAIVMLMCLRQVMKSDGNFLPAECLF